MIHTCAKNQANQGGSCISGVSVLRKATLKNTIKDYLQLQEIKKMRTCRDFISPSQMNLCIENKLVVV